MSRITPRLVINIDHVVEMPAAASSCNGGNSALLQVGRLIVSANGVSPAGSSRDLASRTSSNCGGGAATINSSTLRNHRSLSLSHSDFSFTDLGGGLLGRGSSGSVRRVLHSGSDKMLAVKEIRVTSDAHLAEIRHELETLHHSHRRRRPTHRHRQRRVCDIASDQQENAADVSDGSVLVDAAAAAAAVAAVPAAGDDSGGIDDDDSSSDSEVEEGGGRNDSSIATTAAGSEAAAATATTAEATVVVAAAAAAARAGDDIGPAEALQLRSRFLVDFHGAYFHEGSVFIAMECLEGSLADLGTAIPPRVLARIARDILGGLRYLHCARRLVHRDLKPANALFGRDGKIKIGDFGVSSQLTKSDAQTFIGTVTYMSPERLRGERYGFAADVWSLGILIAELALGAHPYASLLVHSHSQPQQQQRAGPGFVCMSSSAAAAAAAANGAGSEMATPEARFWALVQHLSSDKPSLELPAGTDALLKDFVRQCLQKDASARPTAEALLREHPLVREYAAGSDDDNDAAILEWLRTLPTFRPRLQPDITPAAAAAR